MKQLVIILSWFLVPIKQTKINKCFISAEYVSAVWFMRRVFNYLAGASLSESKAASAGFLIGSEMIAPVCVYTGQSKR